MMNRKLILIVILILSVHLLGYAAPNLIIITADEWSVEIDQNDISGGAGGDTTEVESAAGEKSLFILFPSGNWRMDVSFGDTSAWDSRLKLYVRRTGGNASGGTAYMEIDSITKTFFSGTSGYLFYLPIQYRINGDLASTGIASGIYTVEVVYTVTDSL
jgi:hypothetical protein